MRKRVVSILLGVLPVVLLGCSTGPAPKPTGAPVDSGTNCTLCHRTFAPANSDPADSVVITALNYVPGLKQTIQVTVSHPAAVPLGLRDYRAQ
jgi:hypothetical protein